MECEKQSTTIYPKVLFMLSCFYHTQLEKKWMSLRVKTLFIIGAVLASLVLILYLITQTVLVRSYEGLEEQNTHDHVERALIALNEQIETLSANTFDYAYWDDSYQFMVDRNEDYVIANLDNVFFINLGVNLEAFISPEGETVYIKTVDLQAEEERPVPEDFATYITPGSPFLDHADLTGSVAGIVLLDEAPMLLSSRAILNSQLEGPSRGSLFFGQFLDEAKVQELSESLRLPLTIQRLDQGDLPADFQNANANLTVETPIFVKPLDDATVSGYGLVEDINGNPALLMRVDLPRDIYTQGQSSIQLFLGLLIIVGMVFVGMTILLLERTVISRLLRLETEVTDIATSGNIGERVAVTGTDELSELERDINKMLESLEKAEIASHDSDQRLRMVVRNVQVMLWTVDENGLLKLLEGKSLGLIGLQGGQGVGKPAAEIFRNMPQLVDEIRKALNGEAFNSVVPIKDHVFDTRYVPIRDKNSQIIGMVGVATDITEHVQAERALKESADNLKEQQEQLERAHTLIGSTIGQLKEAMDRGAESKELSEYLDFVRDQFERLN
jgi:PAS domain S-box-containing protein